MLTRALLNFALLAFAIPCFPAADERNEAVTNEAFNFSISYFKGEWRKSSNKLVPLLLQSQEGRAMAVRADLTTLTLDGMVQAQKIEDDAQNEAREISRTNTTIAGEKAILLKSALKGGNVDLLRSITFFVHQGIGYRVIAVTDHEDLPFTVDYAAFLGSFEFLGDRKAWLEQARGKPVPIALAGGLASFELIQPRWTEEVLEGRRDHDTIESVYFKLTIGGAWIDARVVHSQNQPDAELAEFNRSLDGIFSQTQARALPAAPGDTFRLGELTGLSGGYKRVIHTAVFAEDGLALRVYLECLESKRTEMEKDWKQLVRTLKLRRKSDPKSPPAYTIPEPQKSAQRDSSPALDAILAASQRVATLTSGEMLHGLSPDGKSALIASTNTLFFEDLTTHKRTRLNAKLPSRIAPALSPDQKSIAWILDHEIHVASLPPGPEKILKVHAREISFAGSSDELLVSTLVADSALQRYDARYQLDTSALQQINVATEKKTPLISFPFSRTEHAALSPDAKRIALLCNRDEARTKESRIYLCNADGTGLKRITKAALVPSRMAWSADSAFLYAVARNDGEAKESQWMAGVDFYRIPSDGGDPVNLSKCGLITNAWIAGGDVFLLINSYRVDQVKHGLYRIHIDTLEKVTRPFPIPKAVDIAAALIRVSADVKTALNAASIDAVVIDAEVIAKAAKAFADAAARELHEPFDFSRNSIERLRTQLGRVRGDVVIDRAFYLGAGAYYGEVWRKNAGAEWKLKPQPFGQWLPAGAPDANPLIRALLPFSEIHRALTDTEHGYLEDIGEFEKNEPGRKLLLVYPPAAAAEFVAASSDSDYAAALKLMDSGAIDKAGELLAGLMKKYPRNRDLAEETIALCEAAGLPDLAKDLARRAVENGSEVPALLIRQGDDLAQADPAQALKFYSRATNGYYGIGEAFIKLGKLYTAQSRPDLARSCWRAGFQRTYDKDKSTLKKLLFPNAPEIPENPDDLDN